MGQRSAAGRRGARAHRPRFGGRAGRGHRLAVARPALPGAPGHRL